MLQRGLREDADSRRRAARAVLASLLVGLLAALAAGCGSSSPAASTSTAPAAPRAAGLVISGPGLQEGSGPWQPEYAHLAERKREMKLPPVGDEKFHIHAALHIYKEGILVPVPADIGIETAKNVETSLHTHDATGVIHMETVKPYKFTLGDFFKVWGVELGPEQVGGLKGLGGDRLHFYVNGHTFTNPAAYVMHNGDNIAIGYGTDSSFPHSPGDQLLHEVMEGKAGLNCSATTNSKKGKGCFVKPSKPGKTKK